MSDIKQMDYIAGIKLAIMKNYQDKYREELKTNHNLKLIMLDIKHHFKVQDYPLDFFIYVGLSKASCPNVFIEGLKLSGFNVRMLPNQSGLYITKRRKK